MIITAMLQAGGDLAPVTEVTVQEVEKDLYIGGAATALFSGFDTFNTEDNGYGLQANIGYVVFRTGSFSAAIEARCGKTFWNLEDDLDVYTAGAYIVPKYTIDSFGVYGLLGAGYTRLEVGNYTESETDFSYGGGVDYDFGNDISVFVDYVVYPELTIENVRNDVLSVGVKYNF